MNTKFRYEPPFIVDMRGPEQYGEFVTCATGANRLLGPSCWEYIRCNTGTGAERCDSGSYACGCDSCCQTGTGYSTTAGVPWVGGCQCALGSQAALTCNSGWNTGGPCVDGSWAGSNTCSTGTDAWPSLQNCDAGE